METSISFKQIAKRFVPAKLHPYIGGARRRLIANPVRIELQWKRMLRNGSLTKDQLAMLETVNRQIHHRDGMYAGKAEEYFAVGADFFISPGFVPEVAEYLNSKEILYSPGCMTPTEIIAAENAGVKFIKLFPGNMLGPDFLSGIKDIFPNLRFMPTGGVDTTAENIGGWFKAGVSAVGMGSKLISKQLMADKDYATIESETKKVLALIHSITK